MKPGWLALVLQTAAICMTLAGAVFIYSWHVDARIDDVAQKWGTRFGEQSALISAMQSQQATLQAQQIGLQRQFEISEQRHQTFESDVSRKLDAAMVQLGNLSTDLALLRKELKH